MSVAARAATTVWEFSLTEAVLAVVQLGGLVVEVVDRDRDGQVGGGAGGVRGPDGDRAAVGGRVAAAGSVVVGRGGELERRAVDLEQVVVVRLDRVGEAAGVGGVRVGGRERGDGLGVLVDRGRVGRGPAGRLVVEVGHPDGDGGRPVAVVGGAVVDQDGELVDVVPAGVGGVVVVGR